MGGSEAPQEGAVTQQQRISWALNETWTKEKPSSTATPVGIGLYSSRAHMQFMHKAQRSACQTPS